MSSELLASRMLVRNAALALDTNHDDKVMLCAAAKLYATKNCQTVSSVDTRLFTLMCINNTPVPYL